MKPRVEIIALGGTIASKPRPDVKGVFPDLTAQDLLGAVPGISELAHLAARTFAAVPSVEIDVALLQSVVKLIAEREADGVQGIVVTQGTDTIEETAYVLDLLHGGRSPIIVTGAMRNPALPGPDGPANLFAAVACAADPAFQGTGVVVVMDDEIHPAAWVQKRDTSSVGAFGSPAPLGWIAEGKPVLYAQPHRQAQVRISDGASLPFVPILKPGLGEQPLLVAAAIDCGATGLVVELSGGGHASTAWADALGKAAASVPVIFTSRTRGGRVLNRTYGQLGAEIDLMRRGLIPGGDLDALKARLLLSLLLMNGAAEHFEDYANLSWKEAA